MWAISPDRQTPSIQVPSACDTLFKKKERQIIGCKVQTDHPHLHTVKVLEHIMASHLNGQMDSHDLLYDLQHGFREKKWSCETQLTMLIEEIVRNASVGKHTDLTLLDFLKALDKVNHSKLIWKLHQYRRTCAFLGNMSQSIVLDGKESDTVPITFGDSQGSVLGPILFLIYNSDLPDLVTSNVRIFANDTAVYITIEGPDGDRVLWNDLDNLCGSRDGAWFNPSKCQVVWVTTSRIPTNTLYYLHWHVLEALNTWVLISLLACLGMHT